MKCVLIFFVVVFLVAHPIISKSSNEANPTESEPASASEVSLETPRAYPIAPGVWYPGDPLPEQPIRYYRVRCWPGCHRGSSHGKYPNVPLGMRPIFPTSTIDSAPGVSTDTK